MVATQESTTDSVDLSKHSDLIDMNTFEQILEMDEDGEQDFSSSIVFGFFDQAQSTFETMDEAFEDEDFDKLSSLGHFLKGSSATLGLIKVRDACEKIQHCKEDLPSNKSDREKAIEGIGKTLKEVKQDYREVEVLLTKFFGREVEDETEDAKEGEKKTGEKAEKKTPESPEAD